jgi:hypothetical protein
MRKDLRSDESGIALLTVLLVSMLACALMAGMFAAIASDQRSLGFDRDQSQAYSAAHAGLEKLTTQLAQLFVTDFSPSVAQLNTASAVPPTISGFTFVAPGGGPGYAVSFDPDTCSCPNAGNPLPSTSNDITTGPFAGFKGLITPYTLTVTARSTGGGSEVRLRREVQTVAVPVFQFGVFGERSLSFHAGNDFDFGGRVHTNGHLFLAQGDGALLTFRDKLTALGEVVRSQLENGNSITNSGHGGDVSIPMVIGSSSRNLEANEGSVSGGPGSSPVGGWENLSKATYQTNIRNTLTGAKRLDLPLVSQGAVPIDLIRRPALGPPFENVENAPVFGQRYYAQASLRIMLSDRVADLTGLPTITAAAPIPLDGSWNPAGLPPVARSIGPPPVAVTVQATGGTGSTGTGTITVTGGVVPNWLKMGGGAAIPSFTFGGVTVSGCTGMTLTTLTGCDTSGTTPSNTNAAAALNLDASIGGGTILLRTTSASTPSGSSTSNNRTVNVVSTRDLAYGTRVIWASGRPITCTGYSATQLTGCYWSAAPPNGATLTTSALSDLNQSLLGGFIKIERQNAPGPGGAPSWTDVTTEILNLGFSAPNQDGLACADPTPNAVIRLQRLRDSAPNTPCGPSTLKATDFWPNALFDAREASQRDEATTTLMKMGGVMNYVAIDIGNLSRWFAGTIGATGNLSLNNNGFIVYFSDRRGNHNDGMAGAPETGEYGNEDSVNLGAGAAAQTPNGGMPEGGEDRNENGTLQTYGATPSAVPGVLPTGAPVGNVPFGTTTTPLTQVTNAGAARVNRQVLFRRALKLVNGCIGTATAVPGCNAANGVNNLPATGLTIAAENGIYVQGNYNATSTNVEAEPNRPASIVGDSIAILSNNWTDAQSFNSPTDIGGRNATTTGYRFAMIAGKSMAFQRPGWGAGDWGTDGGVHNFMRMLEDWGGETTWYRGAMISLYTARQFIGVYRASANTYSPGTREFSFDIDFLQPALLPPGTPMFRDVNTLRFRQILRPGQ